MLSIKNDGGAVRVCFEKQEGAAAYVTPNASRLKERLGLVWQTDPALVSRISPSLGG